jgi:hypothetical protein
MHVGLNKRFMIRASTFCVSLLFTYKYNANRSHLNARPVLKLKLLAQSDCRKINSCFLILNKFELEKTTMTKTLFIFLNESLLVCFLMTACQNINDRSTNSASAKANDRRSIGVILISCQKI